jgi:tetratricopeptide (TPR) repeat protein
MRQPLYFFFKWILLASTCFAPITGFSQDYFKEYAGKIPVKVHYLKSASAKPMNLLGIDAARGIVYAEMEGAGRLELELRQLQRQNIEKFEFNWSRNGKTYLNYLANEQYDPRVLTALRPEVYKVMLFLDMPFQYLAIHDDCLTYIKGLLGMEQYNEAFYILSRLNLARLDEYGYRDFSEAALELCGKMIASNPDTGKASLALLKRISIRDNSGDHASYLRLADSLRNQGLYTEAIGEYARLGPIVAKDPNSAFNQILEIWPVYCYVKLYEIYAPAAAKDKRYASAATKMFNSAVQGLKKLDENPPARNTNEYSLYKLLRSLIRVQYARQFEARGDEYRASEYYRESVLEVTEGIVNARIGLDWLPESLLMAGDAYEKLDLHEAAKNVYNQVKVFFPKTKWEKMSLERLAKLPQA